MTSEKLSPETATKTERRRLRTEAFAARAQQISERAAAERTRRPYVDALFQLFDRDVEVGGGIIAGALAYRLFIWMLPFALVLVAGLGITAEATSHSPLGTAGSIGLAGIVSGSVASAAKSSSRWYGLIVGIPLLFWATRSVLRALIASHRLVWTDLRATAPRPTVRATARLLVLMLAVFGCSGAVTTARGWSFGAGVLASLLVIAPFAGIWLAVSIRLPHRDAGWRDLIPGALLFGVSAMLIQALATYAFAPMALSKQGTYGALGLAAALLLGLFMIGRVMVMTAALNATLVERRRRG